MTRAVTGETYLIDLTQIINTKYAIDNKEYTFLDALSKTIELATQLQQNIYNQTLHYSDLASNGKWDEKTHLKAQKEQLLFEREVKMFEGRVSTFKEEIKNFKYLFDQAKSVQNCSVEWVQKISQGESSLKTINELKTRLLAIVDDENPKNPLRDAYNWFGQHVMRDGRSPGYIKWTFSYITGADNPHLLIPQDIHSDLEKIIEAGDNYKERSKVKKTIAIDWLLENTTFENRTATLQDLGLKLILGDKISEKSTKEQKALAIREAALDLLKKAEEISPLQQTSSILSES